MGRTFPLQKELLETELDHNEIDYNNYKDMKSQWLPYVKQDVLCTAFIYARYIKCLEEITGFSMKDCLSLPGQGWKHFNGLRTEEDEPLYTYNDKDVSWFVRQSIKGGRVCAFNQYYKSKICDDILEVILKELKNDGNDYDIIEGCMKDKNKHLKIVKEEYESKFDDYRDKDDEEMEKKYQ